MQGLFCVRCGQPTKEYTDDKNYDRNTGKPIIYNGCINRNCELVVRAIAYPPHKHQFTGFFGFGDCAICGEMAPVDGP